MGMLEHTVTFVLLLLLKGHQGQVSFPECMVSTSRVVGLSGTPLQLQPSNIQTNASSVEWKMRSSSRQETYMIVTWKNKSSVKYSSAALNGFNNAFHFNIENFSLLIKTTKPQYSGLYQLELTMACGKTSSECFNVSVFDHVEKPRLWWQWKALDEGMCQVNLSCLVSQDDNVNYTWYRGSEVISTLRNLTFVEKQIDANGQYTYTCNASNAVSWKSSNLTQGCPRDPLKSRFLPSLVIFLILLILLTGSLTCFCVWKRKQSQASSKNSVTVYEDVKNLQVRRNQQQEEEQQSPGLGATIYAMVEYQSSASTSQETNTLYSVVQPSRKSVSKKRNHSPPFNLTIYEEFGKRCCKANDPAWLNRKELGSSDLYS
nr:natural killer cell receptor 2B4 [Castor canadensis]